MTAHDDEGSNTAPARYRVRLPGFVSDEDLGLGDALTRATSSFGMRPCGGCRRRAATLNRWVTFAGWSRPR
jgi:hypothetical protein